MRNRLWQKQVKLAAMVSLRQTKCQLAFNLKLQQVEMWWTVHLEGGPRRVNHAAVAMGERVFSFGDYSQNIFRETPIILSHSGGYCTGDNYRDERPIDVFVLNTSNYRWTEVV